MNDRPTVNFRRMRHYGVLGILVLGMGLLAARAAEVQLFRSDFLQSKGGVNYLTVQVDHATRGMILDRHGQPLAISSPVDAVVANPQAIDRQGGFDALQGWNKLAELIDEPLASVREAVSEDPSSQFVYLKRQLNPQRARQVMELDIAGISLRREYKRFYPDGPVFGHVVGFTDIDQNGLSGVEKSFNQRLSGTSGRTRVLRDGQGRVIEYVEQLAPTVDGEDVRLSIDARIQYLTFRYLRAAYRKRHADSAIAVVLDANTGEILAMVSEPTVNPNTHNRAALTSSKALNRAIQSAFEPGSAIKPFTIAAALASGKFVPETRVDTRPGVLMVGGYPIRDVHNYGLLTVARVLIKSSNVGAAKIAMQLDRTAFPAQFKKLGFGQPTGIPLPGEVSGRAPAVPQSRRGQASLAYGYGISATALQLARAYTVFAGDGRLMDVRLTPGPAHYRGRVYSRAVVRELRRMMWKVTSEEGTGTLAQMPDYPAAGKTGTAVKWLPSKGRYADHQYRGTFVGYAPAFHPRLIVMVMLNNPKGGQYYGGLVAAPVFSKIMRGALHLLNVPTRPVPPNDGLQQAMFAVADS